MADPRDREGFFNEETASKNTGGEGSGVGDEGKDGGAKGVEEDEVGFGDSFGSGGANKVCAKNFEESRAGESSTDADEGQAEAKRGEYELRGASPACRRA